ncbi:hypothetical protein F2P56_004094 [Juglans regia]|uniref:Uncharacterized protein n=1 Tax=Juglans regia TaxID=51240 RepID=A0A833Y7K6_JUGRE|nr:hypothetical protein F2P56_004094 [Juglans regia]
MPRGVVEDVLVQVDRFYYPVDFVVLDMKLTAPTNVSSAPVILERPFLATSNAIINCRSGVLKLSFGNMTLELNFFNLCRQSQEVEEMQEVNSLEAIPFEDLFFNIDSVENFLSTDANDVFTVLVVGSPSDTQWRQKIEPLPLIPKSVGSPSEDSPTLELKALPVELKYAYLGLEESFPVVISSQLTAEQEGKLLEVLVQHKSAIGWTIANMRGINPFTCTHRIYLEEGAKPSREV